MLCHLLISQTLLGDNVFATLRRIEVNWQFNSLSLIDSQREIRLLLQVLESEALEVLLGEGLRVEDAGGGNLASVFAVGAAHVSAQVVRHTSFSVTYVE